MQITYFCIGAQKYKNLIFGLPNLPACSACLQILGISPNSIFKFDATLDSIMEDQSVKNEHEEFFVFYFFENKLYFK